MRRWENTGSRCLRGLNNHSQKSAQVRAMGRRSLRSEPPLKTEPVDPRDGLILLAYCFFCFRVDADRDLDNFPIFRPVDT